MMQSYIVYLGDRVKGDIESTTSLHRDLLRRVTGRNSESRSVVCSFKRSFNGFVVSLTEEEMLKMAVMEGVVSVFPNEKRQLHTTRSWDFMVFPQDVSRTSIESDIIVGVIDSGIWPESESFNDSGYGPPPAKWKGVCQSSADFTCNKKIIGARYYRSDGNFGPTDRASPRDSIGHGTHTASTAAGNLVNGASLFGLGHGTARGGVPAARVAVYKVCWSGGCHDAHILKAFDDAIADGVDIISVSIGSDTIQGYFNDPIAVGSFHAMRRGILTSTSAGNSGPGRGKVANIWPWCLTVAASTTDRRFVTPVKLGNGRTFEGRSVNTFDPGNATYPIVYNSTAGSSIDSRFCYNGTLNQTLVKDKNVLCNALSDAKCQLEAGAIGTIMFDSGTTDHAIVFPIPATYLKDQDGAKIRFYVKFGNPFATIFKSKEINDTSAPFVAAFSSRGPNPITPGILKPDLSAPVVEILAAWSPFAPISGVKGDVRVAEYNVQSGTSMACPHVTAAAAYVKTFHPTWSPAAIKSALMTTAAQMRSALNPEAEFAYGSGHVYPVRALDPGLVYNATETDYMKLLRGQGYSDESLRLVAGDSTSKHCSSAEPVPWELNYPSLALPVWYASKPISRVFNRVVTNVGSPASTYNATVAGAPAGLSIDVSPKVLRFSYMEESLSFSVTVRGTIGRDVDIVSASLVWDDGVHKVRAPIVVYRVYERSPWGSRDPPLAREFEEKLCKVLPENWIYDPYMSPNIYM